MGCDIHLFIEHKEKDYHLWQPFGEKYYLGRIYEAFALMCGVRNEKKIKPISKPRGLPNDVSYIIKGKNSLLINDQLCDADGYCSSRQADVWIADKRAIMVYDDNVTNPHYHSHSWLSPEEFHQVVNSCDLATNGWKMVAIILKEFETMGEDARVVFWFDN